MRGATHAKWAVCAVAVALAATACGGGGNSGGSGGDGSGVVRSSWGDPQNPLEPANTNEVQGGKVMDMLFRGLKRYNSKTGAAEDMLADKIETTDSINFKITVKDGWTFSNGEKVTAQSFVDAWNYGADLRNNQKNAYFFGQIDGYDKVHPDSGTPSATNLSGLKVTGPLTFSVKLNQKFSLWPDTLGYAAFAPLPKAFFDNHAAWVSKPIGNGPYTIESYTKGSQMSLRKWDAYPGTDKAQNGGVDLKVYTDNNTAYTDLTAGNLDLVDDVPASQLKNVNADLNGRYINTPASTSSRRSPSPSTTPRGTRRTATRSARACRWRSTASRSPRRSSRRRAPRPRTGPRRSSARTAASRTGCAATAATTTPARPRSWSRRAAASPAAR